MNPVVFERESASPVCDFDLNFIQLTVVKQLAPLRRELPGRFIENGGEVTDGLLTRASHESSIG
jgi:hypothetical protein